MKFSLGLIEVQALGHAIFVLDAMTKAADVEFVATERRLGGRLVTLVVKGSVSAVTAAIDAGKEIATQFGALKAAEVIAQPHPEILKFLHLDEHGNIIPVSESAATHVGAVAQKEEKPVEKEEKKKTPVKATEEQVKKVSKAAKPASDRKTSPRREAKKQSK